MFHCNQWSRRLAYAQGYAHGHHKPYYETRRHNRHAGRGDFGVRRPLRYLSYHLDLDEAQRRKVAASFERIKLEREQASLDKKKSDANVADQLLREDVSVADLSQALAERSKADETLQTVLAKELYEIVAVLDEEQREEFAHLVRTGVLKL